MMGWAVGGLVLGMVGEKVDEEARAAVEEVVLLRSIQEVEAEEWVEVIGEGDGDGE